MESHSRSRSTLPTVSGSTGQDQNPNQNPDSNLLPISSSASHYSFDNYQEDAGTTAIYPGAGTETVAAINYAILGLTGEAGEIANKWKKLFRDHRYIVNSETTVSNLEVIPGFIESIIDELGDVLWYCANLATELGVDFGRVADNNYQKLFDRSHRNVLHGDGDER